MFVSDQSRCVETKNAVNLVVSLFLLVEMLTARLNLTTLHQS